LVEVLQALEGASRQEVGFYRPKTALFARFSIGMLERVAAKEKTVFPGKASISGTMSAWDPVPRRRARLVLSIMHWRAL